MGDDRIVGAFEELAGDTFRQALVSHRVAVLVDGQKYRQAVFFGQVQIVLAEGRRHVQDAAALLDTDEFGRPDLVEVLGVIPEVFELEQWFIFQAD